MRVRASAGAHTRAVVAAALGVGLLACSPEATDPAASNPPPEPAAVSPPTPPDRTAAPADAPTTPASPAPAAAVQSGPLTFDGGRAYEDLRRQVSFGPRPAGSAALAQCRQYLIDELRKVGIPAQEQVFEAQTPTGRVRMVNVIATIPGKRPERIALATHYDTKLFREFRFVGASDGASSTAAVLELGRVLKRRENEFTIELLFFDGEEAVIDWYYPGLTDNTYGSRHYVQAARTAGTLAGLKALVLLDMIGDRDLTIRRDTNSTRWLVDAIWAAAEKLGYREYFLQEDSTVLDDHMPFVEAGVPAVQLIDFEYPAWHTARDDLDQVSARSLQIVGDTVLAAMLPIERRLASGR